MNYSGVCECVCVCGGGGGGGGEGGHVPWAVLIESTYLSLATLSLR